LAIGIPSALFALNFLGVLAAAFWQNKRFDDLKDLFRAELGRVGGELGRVEGELKAELRRVEGVLGRVEGELKAELKRVDGELKAELRRVEGVLGAKVVVSSFLCKRLQINST
jgi:hypothetical protein